MEFKGLKLTGIRAHVLVDIGTEWNLKYHYIFYAAVRKGVDIGTEWNLKTSGKYEKLWSQWLI